MAATRRSAAWWRNVVIVIAAALLPLAVGFVWFADNLPPPSDDTAPTDAIVVLTGGSDRLSTTQEHGTIGDNGVNAVRAHAHRISESVVTRKRPRRPSGCEHADTPHHREAEQRGLGR